MPPCAAALTRSRRPGCWGCLRRRWPATGSGIIPPGRFYLHGEHIDSHDSRYDEIGLVPRERVLGRAAAMPDIPWLGLDGPLVGPEERQITILPHPAEGPPPDRGPGQARLNRDDPATGGNGRPEAAR